MIKNLKHLWKHDRGIVILGLSYLIPAVITYAFTVDKSSASIAGAVGIFLSIPLIWKLK